MASVNKVILIGTLGRDPELRQTPNGNHVCTLSLATNDSWLDGEEWKERTNWHRVIVWGTQAQNCAKYLEKGRSCYVEGRIQTRTWDDENGQKHYATEVVASSVLFLGKGQSGKSGEQEADAEVEPP